MMNPEEIFPLENPQVSCGLRADLPEKRRRHDYIEMGADLKNKGTEGIVEVEVRACTSCGKDDR
jgi:hypothetical protein